MDEVMVNDAAFSKGVFCRYSDGVLLTHTVVGSGDQSV